jgi:hypothetical protein
MSGQMTVKFHDKASWHAAIAAAVREGLTFEAWDYGMASTHAYVIEYTGGY